MFLCFEIEFYLSLIHICTENEVGLSDSTDISEIAEFDESAVMSSLEVHSRPVSYTHLDVYKRQINNSTMAPQTETNLIN